MGEPVICGVGTAVPDHVVTQDRARDFARSMFGAHHPDIDRLLPVFDHAGVERRHFCVPPEWFEQPHGFAERNDLYIEHALALSLLAAQRALDDAGVVAAEIGTLLFVSTTGIATPSLDARLAIELGCPADARRDATFGHGCAGGVGGLARAAAHARADPSRPVLLVTTELCGLTFQGDDWSKANFVSTSLFADGSAAVVVDGAGRDAAHGSPTAPRIVAEHSVLWPGTEDTMGFAVTDGGLQVVLDRNVPSIVRTRFAPTVEAVCARAGLEPADIDHHLLHPGGAKVLDALADALDQRELCWSREILRRYGNMSAPTALFVLRRALDDDAGPGAGDHGLLSAMGPGFAAEHVVLAW